MITYESRMLDDTSDVLKEAIIKFILDNKDATIDLEAAFWHEVDRHMGAGLVLAYDDGVLVGVHMWRSSEWSGYIKNNAAINAAIAAAGYILSELVVTLMTAVKESHRGQGIGSAMYDRVAEDAASKGYKAMMPVVPGYSNMALAFLTGKATENPNTKMLGFVDEMGYEMRVIPFV